METKMMLRNSIKHVDLLRVVTASFKFSIKTLQLHQRCTVVIKI